MRAGLGRRPRGVFTNPTQPNRPEPRAGDGRAHARRAGALDARARGGVLLRLQTFDLSLATVALVLAALAAAAAAAGVGTPAVSNASSVHRPLRSARGRRLGVSPRVLGPPLPMAFHRLWPCRTMPCKPCNAVQCDAVQCRVSPGVVRCRAGTSDPRALRLSLFWIRTCHGLLCCPYLLFKLPVRAT